MTPKLETTSRRASSGEYLVAIALLAGFLYTFSRPSAPSSVVANTTDRAEAIDAPPTSR